MKTLHIDLEVYSGADLNRTGVYRYAEDPDFEILLFGYSVDDSPVRVLDLTAGEQIPDEIISALSDSTVQKWGHNVSFERVCLSRWLKLRGLLDGDFLDPVSWRCTMVWSAYLGLPLSLGSVGAALGLEKQKLTTGKELIRYFCKPCTPTKSNGGRTRNLPTDAPEKWAQFVTYNKRDVETEMEIQQKLSRHPVPDQIWEQYRQDQEINDRGILVDTVLVDSAIEMDARSHEALTEKMRRLTQVDNPSSVMQLKQWLAQNGMEVASLGKKDVSSLIKEAPPGVQEVLSLRLQLGKSSVKKYTAMCDAVCADHRIRGCFQFYGAARTGRFSGRLVQLQNLFKNSLPDLAAARELVRAGDYETVDLLYGSVPDVLSELIRTAFIAPDGMLYYVADFSAIEARVLAWLAGESWRMEVFHEGKDIYCASASAMFHVPVVKHGINGHMRQKGKIAELALGYGGSVGALKAMGALEMGLTEDELAPLVRAWRSSNQNIVRLWYDIDSAAMKAVADRTHTETHGIRFSRESGMLFVTLPSGRQLAYVKPEIGENRFGSPSLTFMGVGATKHWERIETFGAKICENLIQGIARDILCYAMGTLRECRIVAHVHDELIIEAPADTSLEDICERMGRTPPWAQGLELRADGYTTPFYLKD